MKIQVRRLAIALAIAGPFAVAATANSPAAPINGMSIKAAVPAVTTDVRYRAHRNDPYPSYLGYPSIDQALAADRLPAFDIGRNCREETSGGVGTSVEACTKDETDAKDQLATSWSRFGVSEKKACVGESSVGGGQSYVELLTCLEMSTGQFAASGNGSETTGPRQRARSELRESAAVGVSASSPAAVVRAQPVAESTENAQHASAFDQPPTPSGENGVDKGTQVAELNQTIKNLRSELASSAGTIARLEKDKEDVERDAAQAQQARRDAESAKLQIEEARVAKTIQPDAKNHGLAILAYTTLAGLVILLPIGISVRRRRAVGARPT